MAQGDSQVSICTIGMIAIGCDPITDINQPVKRAILCKASYDRIRREVLEAHPWRFAKKLAQLSASTTAPAFGYGAAYDLPSDFIRMFADVDDAENDWEIVGSQLMTNEGGPINIVYICDITDPSKFSPLFCKLLGLEIGVQNCIPITQSTDQLTNVTRQRDETRALAANASATQASSQEPDVDVLLRSRS